MGANVLQLCEAIAAEIEGWKCAKCGGSGWYQRNDNIDSWDDGREHCPFCSGTGRKSPDVGVMLVLADALEDVGDARGETVRQFHAAWKANGRGYTYPKNSIQAALALLRRVVGFMTEPCPVCIYSHPPYGDYLFAKNCKFCSGRGWVLRPEKEKEVADERTN